MSLANHTGTIRASSGGVDNYGQPKENYLTKLKAMDDDALYRECYSMIYQSARCANNLRADWHWRAHACYDESKGRDEGKAAVYDRAWNQCVKDNR